VSAIFDTNILCRGNFDVGTRTQKFPNSSTFWHVPDMLLKCRQHSQLSKLRSANLGNERPSCQKAERANFPEENTSGLRSPCQKSRKGPIPKKLVPKSKQLELNCTNSMLKIHAQIAPKRLIQVLAPDYVKNKTIRVLLDSGSSGDLLFMKKRVQ
jgi:hypothetical protein